MRLCLEDFFVAHGSYLGSQPHKPFKSRNVEAVGVCTCTSSKAITEHVINCQSARLNIGPHAPNMSRSQNDPDNHESQAYKREIYLW